jgi:ribose transport system substrate-binding protein
MIPPLAKAQAAGIKVINIDGDLAEKSIGITNIQSNDTLGGQEAGQEMAKLTAGKTGSILIEDNAPGYLVSEQRRDGLINYLKQHDPKDKILPIAYTNNEVNTAASDVRAAATAHSDLIGV